VYHARLEQTGSELQAQIDRLTLALKEWRETQDHLQPVGEQLTQLTERFAEILSRWSETDERHAHAVSEVEARLGEWGAIEHRLQQHTSQRLREFEVTVEHERNALREMHEEPVQRLREQAAALGETCVAAANLARRGFERAEARFAAIESDLKGQLSQLSRDVQAALAEVRHQAHSAPPLGAGVTPFPLEDVMRIQEGLREPAGASTDLSPLSVVPPPAAIEGATRSESAEAAAALSDRMQSLEREITSGKEEARETMTRAERMRRDWRVGLGVIAGVILLGALLGLRLQQRVNARLDDAATRVAAAERQAAAASDTATRQVAATRAEADRQIAEARQAAVKAQIVSSVLAAPDLIRYNVTGADHAAGAYGQVLWSRSRGLVLSASRLPAAPAGKTYHVWFNTNAAPVSVGSFAPDSEGRATLVTENPANVPVPVTAISVTLEPAGGTTAPSGPPVLARPPTEVKG
jgi:hypothetical protein